MSSATQYSLIGLGGYCVLIYIIARLAESHKKNHSFSEHFLANRNLGFFTLFFTIYATIFSGNSLLGHSGQAFFKGFQWIIVVGVMLANVACLFLIVPKLRPLSVEQRFFTPGDYLRHTFKNRPYAKELRVVIALIMLFALGNYLFAQLKALGELTEWMTDGAISYTTSIFGLVIVMLWYESVGGMRAVVWTDTLQGILMFAGLIGLSVWLSIYCGGIQRIIQTTYEMRLNTMDMPSWQASLTWLSTLIYIGLASIIYPQTIQRIFSAKTNHILKQSLMMTTFLVGLTTFLLVFIGWSAIGLIQPDGLSPDQVLPKLLGDWSKKSGLMCFFATAFSLACLAAIMSTADSVLLSFGSVFSRDFLGRTGTDSNEANFAKKFIIAIALLLACIASFRDITLWRLVQIKFELLAHCVPALVLSLHTARYCAKDYLIGILVGATLSLVFLATSIQSMWHIHVGLLGLIVNYISILTSYHLSKRALNPAHPYI